MDVISQRKKTTFVVSLSHWGNGRYYHICRLNYDLSAQFENLGELVKSTIFVA